jgi:hypothetical protein
VSCDFVHFCKSVTGLTLVVWTQAIHWCRVFFRRAVFRSGAAAAFSLGEGQKHDPSAMKRRQRYCFFNDINVLLSPFHGSTYVFKRLSPRLKPGAKWCRLYEARSERQISVSCDSVHFCKFVTGLTLVVWTQAIHWCPAFFRRAVFRSGAAAAFSPRLQPGVGAKTRSISRETATAILFFQRHQRIAVAVPRFNAYGQTSSPRLKPGAKCCRLYEARSERQVSL